jgi:hypothetical protein
MAKTTQELLRRRLQEIDAQLELLAPALVKERQRIENVLESFAHDSDLAYSRFTSPWEAISQALDLKGDYKLTKKEVIDEIMGGGYQAASPRKARGLLNDSLNHHIKRGFLSLRSDLVGRPKTAPAKGTKNS